MNINATLLGQTIMFALFVWFCMRFIWPPVIRALEARKQQIADGLAAAERGKHDLELAAKRSADLLREAKGKAAEIIAQGEKLKAEMLDQAKASAQDEAERIMVAARAEVDQEVSRAREALRHQVADLAVAGAAKILQREVDAKAHADLLSALKQEL
ncbi:MAG: F0F1 ATP synthase subunit B [Proteobacteria bacterium]|nr:F0F1 ATP synthase subunit B [Pseudomonadota bacterium]MCL2309120.1 F0F1 ATP synthase subunit B [Pseudomonadota bacterium]